MTKLNEAQQEACQRFLQSLSHGETREVEPEAVAEMLERVNDEVVRPFKMTRIRYVGNNRLLLELCLPEGYTLPLPEPREPAEDVQLPLF